MPISSPTVEEGLIELWLTEINRQGTLIMAYNDLNEWKLDKEHQLNELQEMCFNIWSGKDPYPSPSTKKSPLET
jgi:hypothetical protein